MVIENSVSGAEEHNPRIGEFEKLLHFRDYAGAEEFIRTRLNGELSDFRERAAYCSAGYYHMRALCQRGRFQEARRLGYRFKDLGFDIFYEHFTGRKCGNNKINKPTRRQ